nr:hypothetical protein [Tanacetum cinerariifolium]
MVPGLAGVSGGGLVGVVGSGGVGQKTGRRRLQVERENRRAESENRSPLQPPQMHTGYVFMSVCFLEDSGGLCVICWAKPKYIGRNFGVAESSQK